jgi:hypothetical protein
VQPIKTIRTLNPPKLRSAAVVVLFHLPTSLLQWDCAEATPSVPSPARPRSFNHDIRPILSEHCFACHGPDAQHRKASLRLDPDEVMPPPSAHKTLSSAQKAKLHRWIQEGAAYEPHWAFIPPQRPPLPHNARDASGHPIDAFVRASLREEGLQPSQQANRSTLIRRVALDLTGLPPPPEESIEFEKDTRADAYERLVDRLMSSRAYAERRAQEWLDLARYADTCGFADDGPQDIWPFRDWVVEALHRNQPFDQFTIEQLAGDMLPAPTPPQLIATGFHRNAPQANGNTYPVEE